MVQLLHGRQTLGLVLLSLSCLPSSTMVATAHPLDSIIDHIRILAESYIPTNPARSSRTISRQQNVLQNDTKDLLAQTGAAIDSLLPSATATKTIAIIPTATPTSLFEDIYEEEDEEDVSHASSTSTSRSDPFIDSSISRRRIRSKRQNTNSGVGNVGSGNSGNYNCGNGNYTSIEVI